MVNGFTGKGQNFNYEPTPISDEMVYIILFLLDFYYCIIAN